MFLILLGLFLTFAAFALDLGNFYLWRLRLDKAARAGSLAGLGFRGIQGWNYVSTPSGGSALINATKLAVQDNLRTYGVDLASDKIKVAYDSGDDSIAVSIHHTPSTILIGKLDKILNFGFNSQTDASGNSIPLSSTLSITRQHEANLNSANVVLIIDVSGSMLCPASGPCDCRLSNTCDPANSKLARLVLAVQRFAQHFNPNRDRISVIPFNLAAQRLYSFTDGKTFRTARNRLPIPNGNGVPGDLLAVNAMTAETFLTTTGGILDPALRKLAGSNTNHCDALAEGIFELEGLSRVLLNDEENDRPETDRRNLQPFVILFTDGAPNAMRGIFSSSDIPDGHCSPYGGAGPGSCVTSTGERDFYHYALEWVSGDGSQTYRGPGPFVRRELYTNAIPKLFNHSIGQNSAAPGGNQACGRETAIGNPLEFEQTITRRTGGGSGGRGGPAGCFSVATTQFSFSIPYPYTNPDGAGGYSGPYNANVSGVPISTDDTTWRDPNWPAEFTTPTPYGIQKYDELPYYCAIEAADYIRTRFAGTIFTVGLGPATTHRSGGLAQDDTCNDPLQDADDHTSRKDFFLARLAFARSMFTNQLLPTSVRSHYQIAGPQSERNVTECSDHRFQGGTAPPQPKVGYTSAVKPADGDTTYLDLRPIRPASMDTIITSNAGTRRMETQGEYFPTNNADEIPRIFDLIAKTILLRSSS